MHSDMLGDRARAGAPGGTSAGRVPLYDDPYAGPYAEPCALAPQAPEALSRSPARRGDPPLLSALHTTRDLGQRRALIDAQLHRLGFDALGYTRMRWVHGRPQPLAACTAHSDGTWAAHYFRNGYEQVDPRLHEIAASTLPCLWEVADLAQRAPGHWSRAQLGRFVDDLRASGARSGLMVAISGPHPYERGCVSLRSAQPGAGRPDGTALGQALTLAYCVHEFYSRSALALQPCEPAAPEDRLPVLQAAILRGLAQGWGDKQIAARLNLGAHGVDYHLRQLRKRFGAHNRVQLLERAAHALAEPGEGTHVLPQDAAKRCSVAFTS